MGGGTAQRGDAGGIRKLADDARPREGPRGLDKGREIVGRRRKLRVQGRAVQGWYRARRACRSRGPFLHDVSQAIPAERISERRWVEMSYSRRNFLKAAGYGVALTAVSGESLFAASTVFPAISPAVARPFSSEKAMFLVNGKPLVAEYEARTTLWEVIAVKLGLTGTNRSCNRASCGACSVLVDGTPLYSCHTLATEAVGKKILTIEGVGDEKDLHPLQRVGHTRVAADCGFCTAGWVVTAKGLLDKNLNPSEDEVKAALAGHICRCAAYPNIIRAVMDSAAVLRGSKTEVEPEPDSIIRIKMPMVRDYSTTGGHLPGDEVVEGSSKTVTKKWQGTPPENLKLLGKSLPPLPEVAIPRFTGKAQYASRVWFPDLLYVKFLTSPHPHAHIKDVDTSAAERMPGVRAVLTYKNAPKLQRPN